MRISDWSSDVCSSDLVVPGELRGDLLLVEAAGAGQGPDQHPAQVLVDGESVEGEGTVQQRLEVVQRRRVVRGRGITPGERQLVVAGRLGGGPERAQSLPPLVRQVGRSEQRGVGNECGSK